MLISAVQWFNYIYTYIYMYIYIHTHTLFFIFFSNMIYHRVLNILLCAMQASPVAQQWRIHLQCRRHGRSGFDSWVGKIPWRGKCPSTPVFLLGKYHGQMSLVGYSPWGHKELDLTQATACMQAVLYSKSLLSVHSIYNSLYPSYTVGGNVSWCNDYGKQYKSASENKK